MLRPGFVLYRVAAAMVAAAPAGAEVYRLATSDGTVHFTNAPTDPRYRGLGYSSCTAAGWLRLARAETERYSAEIRDASERYRVPARLGQAGIPAATAFNPPAVSV